MQDKYSEILIMMIVVTGLLIAFFVLVMFFLMLNQKKKLLHRQEIEELKNKYEKEILQSQLEIQEQTFRNLSEEIHDNIGQVLSLVKLNIVTMDASSPTALQQKIEDSSSMIGKAIKDLRDLSKGLNTEYISEIGLERAIEHEIAMIRKTGFYESSIKVRGRKYRIETHHELLMFRIVQEVLHNILKHARANRIDVTLEYGEEAVRIKIEDNGTGIAEAATLDFGSPRGNGLKNMKHRASLIGATLQLESHFGEGTKVLIDLPQHYKVLPTANVRI